MTRQDVIYFIEQRFACRLGRPFEFADRDKLQRYVTLDGAAPTEHHRACQLINAFDHIAELQGWQSTTKPVLWWRLKTKVDDSEQLQIMRELSTLRRAAQRPLAARRTNPGVGLQQRATIAARIEGRTKERVPGARP